jgi:hypothetical protein
MQASGNAISQIAFDMEAQMDPPIAKQEEVTCSSLIFAEKMYI